MESSLALLLNEGFGETLAEEQIPVLRHHPFTFPSEFLTRVEELDPAEDEGKSLLFKHSSHVL
jgi:hypothetical protein